MHSTIIENHVYYPLYDLTPYLITSFYDNFFDDSCPFYTVYLA